MNENILWEENQSILQSKSESLLVENDKCDTTKEIKTILKPAILKNITIPKTSGVYKIVNKYNDKCYIGSTKNLYRRIEEHRRNLRSNKHYNLNLQSSWNKYGENTFEFIILEYLPVDKLFSAEQQYLDICKLNPSRYYNTTFDATASMRGKKLSDETRKKISISHIGKKHTEESKQKMSMSAKGKIVSDKTRLKMSLSHTGVPCKPMSEKQKEEIRQRSLGRVFSSETIKKLSEAGKKRILTEEHKQKISIAHKGMKHLDETKIKIGISRKSAYELYNKL